jgi:hypothetical protein
VFFFIIMAAVRRESARISAETGVLVMFRCGLLTYHTFVLRAVRSKMPCLSTGITGGVAHIVRIHQRQSWEASEGCRRRGFGFWRGKIDPDL